MDEPLLTQLCSRPKFDHGLMLRQHFPNPGTIWSKRFGNPPAVEITRMGPAVERPAPPTASRTGIWRPFELGAPEWGAPLGKFSHVQEQISPHFPTAAWTCLATGRRRSALPARRFPPCLGGRKRSSVSFSRACGMIPGNEFRNVVCPWKPSRHISPAVDYNGGGPIITLCL